jgi:hypothetical protein
MEMKTFQHLNPVWKERANFIVGAKVTNKETGDVEAWEQLWSKKISDNTFEICCIPFFLYDIVLGDEVKTDSEFWIIEVSKPSGHFTFRVWFGDSTDSAIREDVLQIIKKSECSPEWYSNNLLAVDAPSEDHAKLIADFLYLKERQGLLIYETGKTS